MKNKIKIYQVDTFTSNLFSGNPAAVCPLDEWLPDKVMQSIANNNNLSETAFFINKKNNFFIRWFTPKVEIDLCGHATLAAAHIIYTEMNYETNYIKFKINSGDVLNVIRSNNRLNLNLPACKLKTIDQTLEELSDIFGIRPKFFFSGNYALVVFSNENEIKKIVPNFDKLEKFPYDGIIATAKGKNVDFVSRFFAPKLGIKEDPVTGSAHCELIPYWSDVLKKKKMIARQLSLRGGELHCTNLGSRVIIGGKAITYMRGELIL